MNHLRLLHTVLYIVLSAVFLSLALARYSHAAELPQPCGDDSRVRCIAFRTGQIVTVYLSKGATTVIQLPQTERVISAVASDDGLMGGGPPTAMKGPDGQELQDPNLGLSVPGNSDPQNFVILKPLHDLRTQPYTITTQVIPLVPDATVRKELRIHVLELHSVSDPKDAMYLVSLKDPRDDSEIRKADAAVNRDLNLKALAALAQAREIQHGLQVQAEQDRAARQAREEQDRLTRQAREDQDQARAASLRLAAAPLAPPANRDYIGQGTESDRIALAPDGIWDDGRDTFLRYRGNRGVPLAWQVMPDGKEATIGQDAVQDPRGDGTIKVIRGIFPSLRLRDGSNILCITNRHYDPVGRNAGTHTTDPGVVRQDRDGSRG